MGGASNNSGAGGSDAGFENTQKSKLTKANQEIVDSDFRERGANKIKKGVKTPSIILNVGTKILSGPLQAGSKITRDFFTDKVLGSKNYKGTSKSDFMSMSVSQQESMYGDYMSGRQSGKTDAYGNVKSGGNNNNSTIISKKVEGATSGVITNNGIVAAAPTKAEVDQGTSTEATLIATNKKGRSSNIITDAQGLGKNNLQIKRQTLGA